MSNKQRVFEQMRISTNDLMQGNDRTVAIVGGAVVDDYLKQLLQIRLLAQFQGARTRDEKRAKEAVEQLFQPDRPLGSFSATTDMCLALGLIGPIAHSDLTYIRKIRNRFAHFVTLPDGSGKIDAVSFKTPQIVSWCKRLEYLRTQPKPMKWPSDARLQFSGTCVWFSVTIAEQALRMHESLSGNSELDEDRPFLR